MVLLIAALALLVSGMALFVLGHRAKAPSFASHLPRPTPIPVVFDRVSRESAVPRSDWLKDPYYDQFDDCVDRGYGGQFRESGIDYYYFIDLPAKPHTDDVVRAAVASQICFLSNHSWSPPNKILGLAQGLFTHRELKLWWSLVTSPEFLDGIEYRSRNIDERLNEVAIGLVDLSDAAILRERMAASGIPQEAVTFFNEEEDPVWGWGFTPERYR